MGPHEPYWRTNTSFSPPVSGTWEQRFQTHRPPNASQNGLQLYESSPSTNSKGSGASVRDDHLPNPAAYDGVGSYFSSPTDSFQTHQWTPSPMKEGNIDDYVSGTLRDPESGPLICTPSMEGTSVAPYNAGSISSRSDGSEYDAVIKSHSSSSRSFSTRYSFMSKPIHPVSFLNRTPEEDVCGNIASGNYINRPIHNEAGSSTPRRETLRWSSGSSMDFTDVCEQLDSDSVASYNVSEGSKCGLCDRLLSQRSPWSSRRIVRSGDMPVTGILSCRHVFHADCLEQTTPKVQKHDPSCPVCARLENVLEQPASSRLRSGLPWLRQRGEDATSRSWSCGQVGDCVEGALHASPRSSMMLLNRSRIKKHFSFKGSSSKDSSTKLNKNGSCSPQANGKSVEKEAFEFSKPIAGQTMLKR